MLCARPSFEPIREQNIRTLLFAIFFATLPAQPGRADNLAIDCKPLSQLDDAACRKAQKLFRDLASAKASVKAENRTLPIALTCPSVRGGVLEFVQKSSSGFATRTKLTFDGEAPIFLEGEVFSPDTKAWFSVIKGNIVELNDPAEARTVRNNIDLASRLLESVCRAPAAVRDVVLRGLAANKASLERR